MSNATLPQLNQKIREYLDARNMTSFKLCSQLGIPHAQFAEAINETNNFPRDQRLFTMLTDLGIDHDGFIDDSSFERLKRRYNVEFKRKYAGRGRPVELLENLPDVLKNFQNLPPSVHKSITKFYGEVEHIFSLFKNGDGFVYCSLNLAPYEMTTFGLLGCAPYIAKAVKEGSFFIYMFPTNALLQQFAVEGTSIESIQFEEVFNKVFQPKLKEEISKIGGDSSLIERRVLMLSLGLNPFFVADHKFALYKVNRKSPPFEGTFCMGLLPFGNQDNAFILPLNSAFMTKFLGFTAWQLQKAANNTENAYRAESFRLVLQSFHPPHS